MNLLKAWKQNIQEIKWKTVNHNRLEFQNSFLDKKITTLTDFFHPEDLYFEKSKVPHKYSLTDPSSIWLIYLLSQKNLGSFELMLSICDVIDFFKSKDPEYLKSKLLSKNGRIDKRSFREAFFEVWLNYRLIKQGVNVELNQCYRNEKNHENEGFDSIFNFQNKTYVIECVKLKSWHEEILKLTYSMLQNLRSRHEKINKFSKPHFETFYIYANPTTDIKNGGKEFDDHLKKYFDNRKNENTYNSRSKSFESIHILSNNEELRMQLEKEFKLAKGGIKITSAFKDLSLIDDKGKIILHSEKGHFNEKLNFQVTANTKNTRSNAEFELHLMNKVKKKIRQHKNLPEGWNLIIAIELEMFKGLNSFPMQSIESFKKLKSKLKQGVSIMIFHKKSHGNHLITKSESIHDENDPFMQFVNQ